MIYTFPIRDPDTAYRDTWLWLPKKRISIDLIKNSLTIPVQVHDDVVYMNLWKDSPNHLGIPREKINISDLSYPVIDLTPSNYEQVEFRSKVVLDYIKPDKDHQKRAFEDLTASRSGILNLGCGIGKTVIAIHHIAHRGVPALIINDKTHILRQWIAEINKFMFVPGEIGWIQGNPSKWNWKCPIALASLKTLAMYADQIPPEMASWFGGIYWDECVIGETLVNGSPIESISKGDLITAYDIQTHQLVDRQVLRTMKRKPEGLVTVHIQGDQVTCTPNHPFLTPFGWVIAGSLTNLDMVLCYNHEQEDLSLRKANSRKGNREILSGLPGETQSRAQEKDRVDLRLVRNIDHHIWSNSSGTVQKNGKDFLLDRMSGPQSISGAFRENESYEPEAGISIITTDAGKQPDEKSGGRSSTAIYSKSNGLETDHSGWKREATAGTATTPCQCAWVENGSCRPNAHQTGIRTINTLQDRHSRTDAKDRNRNRWEFPQLSNIQNTRSEEGRIPTWVRVDRIEIHEPTSDGTFGGRCPGGFVHNLTIEETPTFMVGKSGIVVHNCHHLSAEEFSKTADMFYGNRFGLTATVKREDGGELLYLWHVGDVVHSNLKQDVIPSVTFIKSYTELNMKDPVAFNACTDRRGEIHLTRLVHYVASRPEEIEFERSVIDEGVKRDRDIMAITLSVEHASMLHSLYPGSGVLHAGVDPDERLGILKNSKLTFATVSMAKEALNKQKLDSLIILTEFSNRNVLQQAVGRIQRFLKDKKKTKVIVIWHVNIGPMKRMGYKLMSHFRRWGMKVEVK